MGQNEAGRAGKVILAGLTGPMMILCGCSTVRVKTDYDHAANFGIYRTYAVEPPQNGPTLSPVADAALRTTLRNGLAARGITEVTPGAKPDLTVVPHAKTEEKYSVEQYSDSGSNPNILPYTYSSFDSNTGGTLVVDFVDTSNQKLVFRGTVRGTASIRPERNAEKMGKAAEKVVAKLPVAPRPVAANYEPVTTAAEGP
jgi:hypothetical protein